MKLHEDKEEENRKEIGTQTINEEDEEDNENEHANSANETVENGTEKVETVRIDKKSLPSIVHRSLSVSSIFQIEAKLDWLNLFSSINPITSPSIVLRAPITHPNLAFPTVRPHVPHLACPQPTAPPPPTVPSCKVHISNLAAHTTAVDLEELFSTVGRVVFVDLPRDRLTAQPLGFAFCLFNEEQSARHAVNMFDGEVYGDIALTVTMVNQ